MDWRTPCLTDLCLASRAGEEGKVDLQGVPPVPEQLEHAVGVKDVPTLKLDTSLFLELTGVADSAKLLAILAQGTLASWIQARQAVCFTFDAVAGMATGLKALGTLADGVVFLGRLFFLFKLFWLSCFSLIRPCWASLVMIFVHCELCGILDLF